MKKYLIALPALLLLTACMSVNMEGVTSDGKPVVMEYKQGMSSDSYSTTIDGEYFKGKAVRVDDSVTFGTAFGAAYNSYGSVFGNSFGAGFSSGGKVKAVLIGNAGSSLKCLMEYADSTGMTNFGGIGECVHSDGRTLMVQW